jgi:DNA-binding MarR family transcriptional regulator
MPIRLVEPTDFLVLDALSDGQRNIAPNIAEMIDQDRTYINARLKVLNDKELIQRVGPNGSSGLYRITPLGIAALHKRDQYNHNPERFEDSIHELEEHIEITGPAVVAPW